MLNNRTKLAAVFSSLLDSSGFIHPFQEEGTSMVDFIFTVGLLSRNSESTDSNYLKLLTVVREKMCLPVVVCLQHAIAGGL